MARSDRGPGRLDLGSLVVADAAGLDCLDRREGRIVDAGAVEIVTGMRRVGSIGCWGRCSFGERRWSKESQIFVSFRQYEP